MQLRLSFIIGTFCALLMTAVGAGAAVIDADSTVLPFAVYFGWTPGSPSDTVFARAEGRLDTPLHDLIPNQTYHLTMHMPANMPFRLDPATADLNVILF